ncbi:MAG: hypothetical protein J0M07_31465 [Anaerolineae bacterium]|nr:hypothetical protein [Anaerolineae bacterium]
MNDDRQKIQQYRSWGIGGVIFGLLTLASAAYSAQSLEATCRPLADTLDPQAVAVCTDNFYLASGLSTVVGLALFICGVFLLTKYQRDKHSFETLSGPPAPVETRTSLLRMELERLKEMQREGMINEQEYEQLRNQVINK